MSISFLLFAFGLIRRFGRLGVVILIIYVIYRLTKTSYSPMDELVLKSKRELDDVFEAGETPTQEEMQGTFDGAPLAGALLFRDRYTRELVNIGRWFPWRGKILEAFTETEGRGTNRVKLGPVRTTLFPYDTRILPPTDGGEEKFRLDYDVPENPFFVRIAQDDVKRVGNGLYVGALQLKLLNKLWFFTYFGLQRANQDDD